MELNNVKKYVGKKCRIILKNNYNYTTIIPELDGETINFVDKYGDAVSIDCNVIGIIQVIGDSRWCL